MITQINRFRRSLALKVSNTEFITVMPQLATTENMVKFKTVLTKSFNDCWQIKEINLGNFSPNNEQDTKSVKTEKCEMTIKVQSFHKMMSIILNVRHIEDLTNSKQSNFIHLHHTGSSVRKEFESAGHSLL